MKLYFKFFTYLFIAVAFCVPARAQSIEFFRAVEVDNERTVSRLLAAGFDPNTRDERGQVGLYVALRAGSAKVAAALFAHPAIAIDEANVAGETPLMMAALRGNLEWTARLAERGARINREGWSPLLYAASGAEPKVVAWLLEHGADVESRAPNGTTPLMMAARYGAEASVDLLLGRGADTQRRNAQGLDAAAFARLGGREKLAARLGPTAK
jgi:uncharacterized protein